MRFGVPCLKLALAYQKQIWHWFMVAVVEGTSSFVESCGTDRFINIVNILIDTTKIGSDITTIDLLALV